MVLDLGLPDMSGFEFINRMKTELQIEDIPIVVYTGRELSRKEETELKRIAEAIIVKDVSSPDRLLDETALFLHRVEANLPEHKRQMLEQLHESDPVLAGKTALIVDDDMRNIYALTSLLERHKMKVLYAESGGEGIEMLKKNERDIDVVLMDIMMPEMDGFEATRRIRGMEEFKNLPIIALTAKAMKGDREKCMEAGASDYITKADRRAAARFAASCLVVPMMRRASGLGGRRPIGRPGVNPGEALALLCPRNCMNRCLWPTTREARSRADRDPVVDRGHLSALRVRLSRLLAAVDAAPHLEAHLRRGSLALSRD